MANDIEAKLFLVLPQGSLRGGGLDVKRDLSELSRPMRLPSFAYKNNPGAGARFGPLCDVTDTELPQSLDESFRLGEVIAA